MISSVAAWFSVTGIAQLFSGSFWSVVIMAGSLEFGKLVAASFIYRYWSIVNWIQKTYMMVAVVTLIGITSMGIFGFLSNSYMGATQEFDVMLTKLEVYKDQLETTEEDKQFLKQELEASVSALPDNYITAKRKLREEYNPKIQEKSLVIADLKGKIGKIEIDMVDTGVDVGPLLYISETFGVSMDTAVMWIIFVFIFVFDPLAVMMVISFNIALVGKQKDFDMYQKEDKKNYKVFTSPIDEEDERNARMDVVGQNGNEGLHYDEEDEEELDDIIEDISETIEEDRGLSWQRKPKIKEEPKKEEPKKEEPKKEEAKERDDVHKGSYIVGGQLASKVTPNKK